MDKARLFPYDEGRKDGMPMEIGAKLRQARIAAGLTQEQTAEALGVSRQSISNWENEKNYPDIVSVVRLSDLYAVSLDALLKEEAPMSDYLDYLEESTNTVRSRREQSLLILLCVYLGIWAVSVLFFWLLTGPDDAMGYGIVFCGSCCRSPPLSFHCSWAGADTAEDKAGCCRSHSARCICSRGTQPSCWPTCSPSASCVCRSRVCC